MDPGSQNLSFGDFSNLSVEEHQKVFSILHSSRSSADRKVEFPWDNASFDQHDKQAPSSDPTQTMDRQPYALETSPTPQDISKANPDLFTSEPNRIIDNLRGQPIQFLDNCPELSNQSIGFDVSSSQSGQTGSLNERSDSFSSGSGQGSSDQSREVTPTDGKEADNERGRGTGRLLASMKTYERRNKKKRPPGYYEKIAQEEVPVHVVPGLELVGNPKEASPIYMYVPESMRYSLDKPPPNHPIIPPLSSHPQPVITAPMVMPGSNYGAMPAGALPMYPSPQGFTMQTFQPGMAFPMHPSGMPILPAHLQQQYGLIHMPPQPHMPPPGSQQHIVPMSEVATHYQRSPIDTRPMISQDIRQHPPGFSPADLSMQRRYVPSHQHVPEGHYGIRRTSYTERLPPDGREMTNHRFSEPPPSVREKKQFSPPQKDEGQMIEHSKNIDVINKIDTDLKTAPSIADKGQNSSQHSGETTFIKTKDTDNVMSNVIVSQSNNEQVDPEVVLVQSLDVSPVTNPPCEVGDVQLNKDAVIENPQKADQPENDGKNVTTDSKSNVPVNIETVKELVSSKDTDKVTDTEVPVTETLVQVITSPPAPKASSWAGLFKGASPKPTTVPSPVVTTGAINNSSGPGLSPPVQAPQTPLGVELKAPVSASEDSAAKQLGELLYNYKMSFVARPLQPRGLTNHSNWCYVNATLQALVACPAFYNLLKQLPNFPALTRGPSSTPILDSLVEFVYEFSPALLKPVEKIEKGKKRLASPELIPGLTFEPSNVYKMLEVMESSSSFKGGKQEDAEEFLSCVLNGLHEEMAAAMKEVAHKHEPLPKENDPEPDVVNGFHEDEKNVEEDNQWEQVGPKNRSVFTRKADFAKTPVSDIFAGQIRSAVFQAGSRESAMLEPFFTLQLDIQSDKVYTVKEALEGLVSKESVEGFTCSKTKAQIEVTRRLTLEGLPPVLILHLKFFIYDKSGGCQKLLKKIDYSTDLEINRDLLSPNVRSKLPTNQRMYKLFAVVYHHGKTVTGGHYTTDVYHPGINSWIQMDDSHIKTVHLQQVLKFVSPRVPYLLYYRRMDLV